MIKFNFLFTLLLCAGFLSAQTVDTLLLENFEWGEEDHTETWETFPTGSDATYVIWDADGLTPAGSNAAQFNWYWSDVFNSPDTIPNAVLGSKSWMEGFLPGNRNWFILPPLTIPNNTYTLHWKSAPYQLLRYLDGYSVLAAEGSNDVLQDAFTDTLFQAAQMLDIVGDGNVQALDSFTFSAGYIHSNGLEYTEYYDASDPTLYIGYLEPHSVSLSEYSGKTMYFAFLHDSDDDNLLMIDDILIVGNTVSGTTNQTAADFRFTTFPNPVENNLNVLFRLPEAAVCGLEIADMNGKVVEHVLTSQQLPAGEHQRDVRLPGLPAGTYSITLTVGGQTLSKMLVKK